MIDDMGCFRTEVAIESAENLGTRRLMRDVLVDTGAELSWFPLEVLESIGVPRAKIRYFRQASGAVIPRWTGFVTLYVAGAFTADEVVFGEANDLVLLGARSLEGLNLCVDPVHKVLIDAGPTLAAAAA
jgi:predicted aspartyl protease